VPGVSVSSSGHPRGITRTGAWALVAAGAGLFVMSVMAAAPGSPYQPLLTRHGQPRGPLHDLAVALGAGDLHGNVLVAVSVTITLLALGGFLLLLRAAWRGQVSVAWVAGLVIGAYVLLLFVPLLFSRDVYSYAFYGRIAGIYGGNPYLETPLDHSGDLLWRYVGPIWIDTPAVYGPAWTSLSAAASRFLPRPVDHVEAYRALAIVAGLATCAAIVWVVRRERPALAAFALVAFGANPVVLFHSVASGHNDLLVALSIVVAVGLVLRGHVPWAVGVLTTGALIKATAGLPLLLLLVWVAASAPPGRRLRAVALPVAILAVLVAVFAAPYFQLRDPTLGMLELAGHEGWLAPSMAFSRALDWISGDRLGFIPRLAFAATLLVCIGAIVREVWRRGSRIGGAEVAAVLGWALVLLMLLGPVLLPWYVTWSLPLVWALPKRPRTALIATSVLLAATLWSAEPLRFPGAFQVDTLIGRWVVTPIVLWLLFRAIVDLRSRIRGGVAFDEEVEVAQAAPVAGSAGEPRRVPSGAGER
jgi:alpha-1,6-mannosyltransferase